MRIFLTGKLGQAGGELLKTLTPLGELVATDLPELNLTDERALRRALREARPRWIVNAAAYTAVDQAEREPELAYAINRDAVRVIGEEARALGAGVIHFSTDYVFDGTKREPYCEEDTPAPLNVYGASKLAGEQALAASGAPFLIFRTSWVYGATGKNFLLTILRQAREREELRIVDDQHGAPTWSRDLARLAAHAIQRVESMLARRSLSETANNWSGLYHAAGAGETTWHGFASEAVRLAAGREPETHFARIEAIMTEEYSTPAKRPQNSRLCCAKLAAKMDWSMMDWRDSLREVMAEL